MMIMIRRRRFVLSSPTCIAALQVRKNRGCTLLFVRVNYDSSAAGTHVFATLVSKLKRLKI
jgi:hypothetical protein